MRNFFTLIIGVIIVVLISLSCQDLSTESQEIVKTTSLLKDASNPDIFDLYAGKNILVGKVEVWNDDNNVYIKYVITENDWCLEETKIDVKTSL